MEARHGETASGGRIAYLSRYVATGLMCGLHIFLVVKSCIMAAARGGLLAKKHDRHFFDIVEGISTPGACLHV